MFETKPGIEQRNNGGIRYQRILFTKVVLLSHQCCKFTMPVTRFYIRGKKISAIGLVRSQRNGNIKAIFIYQCVIKVIIVISYSSVFGRLQMVTQQKKIITISFRIGLIPGGKKNVAVIGTLVLKSAGRVYKSILKRGVPVWPYVLGVHYFYYLFCAA